MIIKIINLKVSLVLFLVRVVEIVKVRVVEIVKIGRYMVNFIFN